MRNPAGEMDGYDDDDDDDDYDDGVGDDNLSVDTNYQVDSDDDVDGDPVHWRNMKWNPTTLNFEYMADDYNEISDGTPNVNQWKKIHPREMRDVEVTFNDGRNEMLHHFKAEHDALINRLDFLQIDKTTEGVFTYLFGPQSRLAEVMKRVLDITYKEFAQFLATTYFAAKLVETHRSINYDGHMEQKRLNEIWTLISVAGKTGSGEKLWMEIQDAINKTLIDLFLAEGFRPNKMRIALDDDKIRFHMATAAMQNDGDYLVGIKVCQHVKVNFVDLHATLLYHRQLDTLCNSLYLGKENPTPTTIKE